MEFIEELICSKHYRWVLKLALVEDCIFMLLAAAGQAGVERALEKYKAELVRDMKLMGCTKISDLNRE